MKVINQPYLIEMSQGELEELIHLLYRGAMDSMVRLHEFKKDDTKAHIVRARIRTLHRTIQFLYNLGGASRLNSLMTHALRLDLTEIHDYIDQKLYLK